MRPMLLPAATALHTDALETRHHRVPEPKQGDPLRLDSLRAVLVPGLAFDSAGRRLGRGAGFYDRFLAGRATAESPIRIGVCFAIQLVDAVPAEPHDLPMNRIITEHGVIRCD